MSSQSQAPTSMTQKTLRVAGYHDNIRDFARILETSGIKKNIADQAWAEGQKAKQRGLPCNCQQCLRVD